MRRNWTWALRLLALLLTVAVARLAPAQGTGESLVPDTTKGFVSVTNVKKLTDHWNQTQLGQLMKDPVMKPFVDDLQRQIDERWAATQTKLGLTVDDLRGVASGELVIAIIEPARGQEGTVLLAEIKGNVPQAQAVVDKASANLTQQGAKRTESTIGGTAVVVFDLPKQQPEDRQTQALYFLTDTWLGAADNPEAITGVLARMARQGGRALADVPAYQAVMARVAKDAGKAEPQVRWFVEPFGYARTLRAAIPERQRQKGKTMGDILEEQGFTGIQGMGGFIDFAVDGYEALYRACVYAPSPREAGMKMLVLPNGNEFSPQPWVPRNVATYATGYADPLAAFDNFGPLFDQLFGEGETGVWADVLEGLEKDPYGPQIDLRKELVEKLGKRFTAIADYQEPITTTSERMVFALETTDEKAATAALDKMFRSDKQMRKRTFEDRVIWETIPTEKPVVPAISLEAVPSLVPEEGPEQLQEEEVQPLFPNAAVTAAHGQLLVASHLDALVRVLEKRPEERETLVRSIDFQRVQDTIGKLGIQEKFFQSFTRTDEQYRVAYELIRQGKMPQSESLLGRVLNTIFEADKKGELRQPEIEGSKLPDYEVVRRYLGPAGMLGSTEENGWFFKGFALNKQAK